MPFEIKKYPDGWYVENKITKQIYSNHPMTQENAIRQLHALNRAYVGELEGGDFKDVWKFTKSIPGRLTGLFTGRMNYRPQDREFLAKNGDCIIKSLTVYRQPVPKMLTQILNVISFGQWNKYQQKYGYDKFFHLYLKVDYFDNIGNLNSCKVEKNEVITISKWDNNKDTKDSESFPIKFDMNNLTIHQMLNNTLKKMGAEKYFSYRFDTNNCQVFVLSILEYNNLLADNPDVKNFIFQDIKAIVSNVNRLTSNFANATTDLAHRFNVLTHGMGLTKKII